MRYPMFVGLLFAAAAMVFAGGAVAQQLYVYPNQGQGPDQQNRDRGDCHVWAVQQSGYDPANPPIGGAPPPSSYESQQGGLLRGAGRGAAGGAIIGGIAGNPGKGAAIGAASGAFIGGMRRRDQQRRQEAERQQYYQQQQANQQYGLQTYNRAFGACMQGRG